MAVSPFGTHYGERYLDGRSHDMRDHIRFLEHRLEDANREIKRLLDEIEKLRVPKTLPMPKTSKILLLES